MVHELTQWGSISLRVFQIPSITQCVLRLRKSKFADRRSGAVMDSVAKDLSRCPVSHKSSGGSCPHARMAAEFNPFQDAYMENPSEFVRWAREELPVFYSPELDYWVVTRYQAIKEIFRDPITFSPSNVLEPVGSPPPEVKEILGQYGYAMNRTLVNEDEPMHMARRRVLMEPFTPEHLREHEPMVRRLVTES